MSDLNISFSDQWEQLPDSLSLKDHMPNWAYFLCCNYSHPSGIFEALILFYFCWANIVYNIMSVSRVEYKSKIQKYYVFIENYVPYHFSHFLASGKNEGWFQP